MSSFGQYVRQRRVAAGISMRRLAEIIGISHVYLGMIERGEEAALPEKYWERLLEAVPDIRRTRLEYLASENQLEIDLTSAGENEHRAAFALRRRIQEEGMSKNDLQNLLRILGFSESELFDE